VKDVVHDAEINLFAKLSSLPIKNNLMNSIDSGDERFRIGLGEKVMIIGQNLLHKLKFMSRDGFQYKSAILCVIEERTAFA
jgi:hypothetical protein